MRTELLTPGGWDLDIEEEEDSKTIKIYAVVPHDTVLKTHSIKETGYKSLEITIEVEEGVKT